MRWLCQYTVSVHRLGRLRWLDPAELCANTTESNREQGFSQTPVDKPVVLACVPPVATVAHKNPGGIFAVKLRPLNLRCSYGCLSKLYSAHSWYALLRSGYGFWAIHVARLQEASDIALPGATRPISIL